MAAAAAAAVKVQARCNHYSRRRGRSLTFEGSRVDSRYLPTFCPESENKKEGMSTIVNFKHGYILLWL